MVRSRTGGAGTRRPGQNGKRKADSVGTREQILRAASAEFAKRGYSGATTRDISKSVGIRQPSLFHHFDSKSSMLKALLEAAFNGAEARAARLARENGAAAPRLYAFVLWDLTQLTSSPYDYSGVYAPDIMAQPEFTQWRRELERLHDAIRELVSQGVKSGEFIDIDPALAERLIAGTTLGQIQASAGASVNDSVRQAAVGADFVLRGLMRDPETMDGVKQEAQAYIRVIAEDSDQPPIGMSVDDSWVGSEEH